MKKIYVQPSLVITKIHTQSMIATSLLHKDGGSSETFEQNDFTGTTDETGGNLSRYNVWGDEDEDY